MSEALQAFIDGPLSDATRGSTALKDTVVDVAAAGQESLEDQEYRGGRSRRQVALQSAAPLFSYQREIVDALHQWYRDSDTRSGSLVALPTGGGKTRTAVWFTREAIEEHDVKRVLWIAPSIELVDQAGDCFEDLWRRFGGAPETTLLVNEFAGVEGVDGRACVVLATAQLAAKRLDAITAYGPELLIFDEAHQAVAATYQPIVSVVMDDGRGKVVGLSATPGRSAMEEATDLRLLFRAQLITSPELGSSPVEYLRRHGVLSQLAIDLLPLPEHLDGMRVRDLTKRYLSIDELALEPSRFWAVVDAVASRPEESKQLVFGASVAHCVALAGALQERGLVAAVLSYETLPGRRRKILEDFRAGEINVLLNKTLLATGYDCPSITDVVLASPIRSPILWEQILGRVSRGPNVGGTKVGYVWELDDHRAMHADVMSYARYLGEVW